MLQKATLISRNTDDGWEYFYEDVPLGKVYWVDVDTIRTMQVGNLEYPGETVERELIWIFDPVTGVSEGWAPLELLKIEASA